MIGRPTSLEFPKLTNKCRIYCYIAFATVLVFQIFTCECIINESLRETVELGKAHDCKISNLDKSQEALCNILIVVPAGRMTS